jgi:nucleoid-associated protein YgaU
MGNFIDLSDYIVIESSMYMKHAKTYCLSIVLVLALSTVAFAMGGPAPEVKEEGTPVMQPAETVPVAITKEAASGEIEKAKAELTSLESEREKIDSYLEALNKKIIKAKTSKNSKQLADLQAEERAMTERQNKIAQRVLAIKQKYPDIKPAEKAEVQVAGAQVIPEEEKLEQVEMLGQAAAPKAAGRNIVYHDVVMGDTLMSISRKYFGTPAYYKDIAKMNNINPIGALPQGSSLMIDLSLGGGKVGTIVKAQKTAPKPAQGGVIYHTVLTGDTLMSISRQYFNGSPFYFKEIAEMNGITDLGQLRTGMKLKIDTSIKKTVKPQL